MSDAPGITEVAGRLREYGIYPTGQRLAIARVLLPRHQHVTADNLHLLLHNSGVQVSRATVYNTLNLFAEKGLVRAIVVDSNQTYFDSNNAPHHHVFNVDDKVLIDVPDELCRLLPEMKLPEGTRIDAVEVVIKVRNHP